MVGNRVYRGAGEHLNSNKSIAATGYAIAPNFITIVKGLLLIILLAAAIYLESCSLYYEAYMRNRTGEQVTIDVLVMDTAIANVVSERVKAANRLVDFSSGFTKYFTQSIPISRLGQNQYQLRLPPNNTIDLTDIAGKFLNGNPTQYIRVVVSTSQRTDTLMGGTQGFRRELFSFSNKLFHPILYYDIR